MDIIECDNVWKSFKRGERIDQLREMVAGIFKKSKHKDTFWALKGINFSVKKGTSIGIIGPNGAGKTTILKLLARVLRPNQGKIKIRGKVATLIDINAGFHPELTGRENIYLQAAIMGMKKKEIEKKIDTIINFAEIARFIDTPIKRYSAGMSVRLGFSIAVHTPAEIMLIDEVLSVGDLKFQKKCLQKMKEIQKKGTTIVFVSHQLELVRKICSEVFLLKEGEIQKKGPPERIIEVYHQQFGKIEA
jgi:ABC-type polysaccharide/polyol phosphate transport system ATPase subunit